VRQYERAPIRERGTLVVNGVSHTGMISRVGGGGLFFESPLKLEKGTVVLVKFRLACFDEAVVVKGEIRWVAAPSREVSSGMGIVDDPEMDLTRLREMLAKVDLDGADSLDEIRARVKKGLDGFFERP
jgi:hypothetical protein